MISGFCCSLCRHVCCWVLALGISESLCYIVITFACLVCRIIRSHPTLQQARQWPLLLSRLLTFPYICIALSECMKVGSAGSCCSCSSTCFMGRLCCCFWVDALMQQFAVFMSWVGADLHIIAQFLQCRQLRHKLSVCASRCLLGPLTTLCGWQYVCVATY